MRESEVTEWAGGEREEREREREERGEREREREKPLVEGQEIRFSLTHSHAEKGGEEEEEGKNGKDRL